MASGSRQLWGGHRTEGSVITYLIWDYSPGNVVRGPLVCVVCGLLLGGLTPFPLLGFPWGTRCSRIWGTHWPSRAPRTSGSPWSSGRERCPGECVSGVWGGICELLGYRRFPVGVFEGEGRLQVMTPLCTSHRVRRAPLVRLAAMGCRVRWGCLVLLDPRAWQERTETR